MNNEQIREKDHPTEQFHEKKTSLNSLPFNLPIHATVLGSYYERRRRRRGKLKKRIDLNACYATKISEEEKKNRNDGDVFSVVVAGGTAVEEEGEDQGNVTEIHRTHALASASALGRMERPFVRSSSFGRCGDFRSSSVRRWWASSYRIVSS
jgi:hypothetical protein